MADRTKSSRPGFTGDKVIDPALARYPLGVVTVERGDGKGRFSHLAFNAICVEDREAGPGDNGEPVFNIAHGDIDKDGLTAFVIRLGQFVSVAKNTGRGRFKRMLEDRLPREAKVVLTKKLHQDKSLKIDDICKMLRTSWSTFYRTCGFDVA